VLAFRCQTNGCFNALPRRIIEPGRRVRSAIRSSDRSLRTVRAKRAIFYRWCANRARHPLSTTFVRRGQANPTASTAATTTTSTATVARLPIDHRKAVQPDVVVLEPHRPAGCNGPFNARARYPPTVNSAGAKRCASGQISQSGLILSPGSTALSVQKQVIPLWPGNAYPTRNRRDPVRVHGSLEKVAERRNKSDVAAVVAGNSIHKPFDAENEIGTNLIIIANLATPDEGATSPRAKSDAVKGVGYVSPGQPPPRLAPT